MNASVKEMKERLHRFLDDPDLEKEFRVWFAGRLRDESDPDAESFAFAVQRVFSDAARGLYTADEAMKVLSALAEPEMAQAVPHVEVKQEKYSTTQVTVIAVGQSQPATGSTNAAPNPGNFYAPPSPSGTIVGPRGSVAA